MANRAKIFISYSKQDRRYLEQLRHHLIPLQQEYGLDAWDDSRIAIGVQWQDTILRALESAKVGVLLVSPRFLASEFVRTVELRRLLEAARTDSLRLCIVHVRATAVQHLKDLSALQAVNDPKRPIASLRGHARDAAWAEIAGRIVELSVSQTRPKQGTPPESLNAATQRVRSYLIALQNLQHAFEVTRNAVFETEDEHEDLSKTIQAYNVAIDDLQARKFEYVYGLASHVARTRLDDWKELFDDVDVDLHGNHAFRLNEIGIRMNRMLRGLVPAGELEAFKRKTQEDLGEQLRVLAKKVPAIQQRVDRLYRETFEEL